MSNLHPALQPTLAAPAAEQFDRRYRQFYTAEAPGYDQIRFSDPDGVAFNTSEQARICELLDLAPGLGDLHVLRAEDQPPGEQGQGQEHEGGQGGSVTEHDGLPSGPGVG